MAQTLQEQRFGSLPSKEPKVTEMVAESTEREERVVKKVILKFIFNHMISYRNEDSHSYEHIFLVLI